MTTKTNTPAELDARYREGYSAGWNEGRRELATPAVEQSADMAAELLNAMFAVRDHAEQNSDATLYNVAMKAITAHIAASRRTAGDAVGCVIDLNNGVNTPSLPPTPQVLWFGGIPPISATLYAAPVSAGEAGQVASVAAPKLDVEAERLLRAVKVYAFNYMQDEAEDEEDCVCGPKQHAEAKEVFAAIRAVEQARAPSNNSPVGGKDKA